MALLSYQYRLYPRRAEQRRLEVLLYQGKLVYNFALEVCKNTYEASGEHVKALSLWGYFRDWRNSLPETERYLNASSLQQLLRRLDKAYAAFFRRVKAGEKAGHPRFKGDDRFNSVEYTYGDGVKLVQDGDRTRLYVHRVGDLKVKLHRPLPNGAVVKHVVLKRKASGWYVNLQLEVPTPEDVPNGKQPVAGDVGLLRLLTLADGAEVDNPRWLRGSLSKLR